MNITFFIGNGFDLNLGLKTRYVDFLSAYVKEEHTDALSASIRQEFETWADLERQLGIYAGSIGEEQMTQFLEEKEALDEALIAYLRKVSAVEMVIPPEGAAEFQKMITGFWEYLPAEEKDHYREELPRIYEPVNYQFINFNYTGFLDRLYDEAKKIDPFGTHLSNGMNFTDALQAPVHIHGELTEELLLGVNDRTQIGDGRQEPAAAAEDYLIKPNLNQKLGNRKSRQAREIIDGSLYVCVFGMSLGITDRDWWVYLGKWLEQKPERRLVLFMYEGPDPIPSGSRRVRIEDEYRRQFLRMIGEQDGTGKLNGQVIVVLNSGLFGFENVKILPPAAEPGKADGE